MIIDVSKIVDNKFFIVTEIEKGTKIYLIGEDKFISKFDNEELKLDSREISDMKYDELTVASLVYDLKELENTYIISYILDIYLRDYTIEQVRSSIIEELNKTN